MTDNNCPARLLADHLGSQGFEIKDFINEDHGSLDHCKVSVACDGDEGLFDMGAFQKLRALRDNLEDELNLNSTLLKMGPLATLIIYHKEKDKLSQDLAKLFHLLQEVKPVDMPVLSQ